MFEVVHFEIDKRNTEREDFPVPFMIVSLFAVDNLISCFEVTVVISIMIQCFVRFEPLCSVIRNIRSLI